MFHHLLTSSWALIRMSLQTAHDEAIGGLMRELEGIHVVLKGNDARSVELQTTQQQNFAKMSAMFEKLMAVHVHGPGSAKGCGKAAASRLAVDMDADDVDAVHPKKMKVPNSEAAASMDGVL